MLLSLVSESLPTYSRILVAGSEKREVGQGTKIQRKKGIFRQKATENEEVKSDKKQRTMEKRDNGQWTMRQSTGVKVKKTEGYR